MLLRLSPELSSPFLFSFNHHHQPPPLPSSLKPINLRLRRPLSPLAATSPTTVDLLESDGQPTKGFDLDAPQFADVAADKDLKHLSSPPLEVTELEELPEQWRRSKIAWLCKELPSHKPATMVRILGAQRKWVRQEDVGYVVLHGMRIRENEASNRQNKQLLILLLLGGPSHSYCSCGF